MSVSPPLILAIDTSTPVATVALTQGTRADGRVLASICYTGSGSHSRRLLSMIDTVLQETSTAKEQIDGIAVGLGPGSFTGLRIALATAKGLVFASGKPLLGCSSLDVVASSGTGVERLICVALDARKHEIYTALYRCDAFGMPQRISEMTVISPQQLAQDIHEPVFMIGDALPLYGSLWRETLTSDCIFASISCAAPQAANLGLLAGEDLLAGRTLDVVSAVPFYIRASDAQLNLAQKSRTAPVQGGHA